MEISERWFKVWCDKNNLFCKKFLTHTKTGYGNKQESDFLVVGDKIYFVEIKEVNNDYNIFDTKRFTQYRKMKLAVKKNKNINCLLFINYIQKNKLLVLDLNTYEDLKKKIGLRCWGWDKIRNYVIQKKDLINFIK